MDGNGGVSRVFCFFQRSIFLSLSLSSGTCPITELPARSNGALGVLVLVLLRDAAFLSWALPLRLSPDKAREKKQDCETIPLLHIFPTLGGLAATCIWLFFFYLSIYFLPFCASSVVDIWSLTLVQYPPPLFARKDERKTGQDTLILNPLQNQNLYRIPSILSCFHFSSKWIARACSSNC